MRLRIARRAAEVLFLLLFPAVVWAQSTGPNTSDESVHEQQNQQLSSIGNSITGADDGARLQSQTQPQSQSQAQSQSQTQSQSQKPPAEPATPPQAGQQQSTSQGKQTKRILGIAPNFNAVDAGVKLPPLSAREKFALMLEGTVDYTSFVWAGILAAQSMALNSYPELHHGVAGYGRYYWRSYADQASGGFFTDALMPALTHEDPRYYTLGHGNFFKRAGYALSKVVITKRDSGGNTLNVSEILGNGFVAGLSNAYYPPEERSFRKTAENFGTGIESAALNNLVKEFWPDIHQFLFHRKEKQ
jgi:hypothetical protein